MSEKAPATDVEVQHNEVVEPAHPLRKVEHVLNADLAVALSTGPQLKAFSGSAFRLYLILLVCFMGSLSFGFDTTVISGVNGMVQFTDYFGIGGGDTGGGQGIVTAMLYSIFSFGCILATFVGGPISDRFGRRGGMFIASIIIFAGVAVVTAAQSRIYLFFGRFLIGFGSALNASASPAYVAEISPPQWRGRIGGLSNTFSYLGSVICSGLVIATGRINSDVSWRLPCAVQFIPTVILAVGVWFIPESPRWLMSVGRKEEARDVLAKYHGNGDANTLLVLLELRELETSIGTGSDKGWRDFFDYSELFNSRAARYRTFVTTWLGICSQLSGGGLFYYITVLFDLAGVKTQNGRLTFSFISVAIGALGGLTGAFTVDRIGRRTLWFWGTVGCSLTLALAAVFTATLESGAAIAFLSIYACECLSYSARAKGLALFALIQSLASLINNFAGSVAFQSIGWKYILVPACWGAVETVVIWFCAVETKGRTLEQLDEIFADPHPVKASLNKYRSSGEGGS